MHGLYWAFLWLFPSLVLLSMELSLLFCTPNPPPHIDLELKHFISVLLTVALDILCIVLISFPSPGPALIPVSAHNVNIDKLSIYLVF